MKKIFFLLILILTAPCNSYGQSSQDTKSYKNQSLSVHKPVEALFATPKVDKKPLNVLFIAVDDLRPEMACYGNTILKTPNMDKLASTGTIFDRAYCQQAICMASRASIMSGMLSENNLIFKCGPVNDAYPKQKMLDDMFKDNGYEIKVYGKIYHHKSDAVKQYGQKWINSDPNSQEKGRGYLDPLSISRIFGKEGRGPAYESPDVADSEYFDGYQAEKAAETLDDFSKSGKPFFLAVGFYKPHLPFNAPKKYWDMYSEDDVKLATNQYLPKNFTKNTKFNFEELRNYVGIPKGDTLLSMPLQRNLIHGYYASVSYTDANIGKLLNKLKETGLDKNTVVVLWGDHGWKLGEHGMWGKHTNFELDAHVPLIIRAPGFQNGRAKSIVELLDLYPTLAELCQLKQPENLQGKSLVTELKAPSKQTRNEAYGMYPHFQNNNSKLVIGYTVVDERYRYINWIHIETGQSQGKELYDHANDPGENVNVADAEKKKAVVDRMDSLLRKRFKMNASILEYKK